MGAPGLWTGEGHLLAGRGPLSTVVELERVSALSWPPLESENVDGWELRAGGGVTRRANSVWPRADGEMSLGDRLAVVCDWYAARGQPAVIQLSPANEPAELASALTGAGWTVAGETDVMTAPLPLAGLVTAPAVRLTNAVDDDWLAVAGAVNAHHFGSDHAAAALAMLTGIGGRTVFALSVGEGDPDSGASACARAVLVDAWLGLFSFGTRPTARRRGHAGQLLAALSTWGRAQGATRAWLQVDSTNTGALALYRRCGFSTVYSYAYASAPRRWRPAQPSHRDARIRGKTDRSLAIGRGTA